MSTPIEDRLREERDRARDLAALLEHELTVATEQVAKLAAQIDMLKNDPRRNPE